MRPSNKIKVRDKLKLFLKHQVHHARQHRVSNLKSSYLFGCLANVFSVPLYKNHCSFYVFCLYVDVPAAGIAICKRLPFHWNRVLFYLVFLRSWQWAIPSIFQSHHLNLERMSVINNSQNVKQTKLQIELKRF